MQKRCDRNIYAGTALAALQVAQSQAVLPALQRCAGNHGLLVSTAVEPTPPALPLLAHWTRLRVTRSGYAGDLVAATDEPLAFANEAFNLVWLSHILEVVGDFEHVLDEALRVLAGGGTLVITGIHPLSAWAPWYYWHERAAKHRLLSPSRLIPQLRRAGMEVTGMQRIGPTWPVPGSFASARQRLTGGGYVLVAHKQRSLVTPLRLRTEPTPLRASGRLSPSARRKLTA